MEIEDPREASSPSSTKKILFSPNIKRRRTTEKGEKEEEGRR